eukprot:CAMPEP_0115831738 /NCGR_PEP_ID=MMETSP0287-20121206/2295_1 /TAXON_ID=412157 /ORGANISM="Chrysochromulina rotalis, Strain UIO044" /LENGTH=509 /DNA_ID=CAMNT_0003285097 /DNA_START=46 /DNA_END=1575 /DNA_ORIENTATION=-
MAFLLRKGGRTVRLAASMQRDAAKNIEALEEANQQGTHGKLSVFIVSGSGLRSADSNGLSDPYVIVKPAGAKAKRCVTRYKTLNPEWRDVVTFEGSLEAFLIKDLKLRVFDRDFTSFNDPLGNCQVSISSLKGHHDGASSKEHEYPVLHFDEVPLTGGTGTTQATGHISFNVTFELTPQRFAFPAAPVHASALQALSRKAPSDATPFELKRDRVVKWMAEQTCFGPLAAIWGVLFAGWVVFFALLLAVKFLGWPEKSGGSAPFTIANMDEGTLKIWLNICNLVVTGLFTYQKALALPWRFAILHHAFLSKRDLTDGTDFYGRPTEAVWFHIPLKWRKRIALLLMGDFGFHYLCQICHLIWYSYETSENPPGNIPTMITFLSSIACGISAGVSQGKQEELLHKQDPTRFPPNPMKYVGDALHKFRRGEIRSIAKLIEDTKHNINAVTNYAEVARNSNRVHPITKTDALEEDVEHGGSLALGAGGATEKFSAEPEACAGEDSPLRVAPVTA